MYKFLMFLFFVTMGTGCAHYSRRTPDFSEFSLTVEELRVMPKFLGTEEDSADDIVHLDRWRKAGVKEDGVHYERSQVWIDPGYSEEEERNGKGVTCLHTRPSPPEGVSVRVGRVRMYTEYIMKTCTGNSPPKDVCDSDDFHPCKTFITTRVIVSR